MLGIMIFSNKMILEGEIKDAKMTSFSSDLQTLIKHLFLLYFNEFENVILKQDERE